MALTDPDIVLFKGGLSTVAHDKSSAEYLKMLAVHQSAAALTASPATARGHIEDDLNTTFGAIKFGQFNGMNHGMKRIYALVARYGLIRSITLQASAAFPNATLANDFAQQPLAGLHIAKENGVRAFEFFVEMQNQVQSYSKLASDIRTYLIGLGLPSTASEVRSVSKERARLAVAAVRMFQSNNWNGTNDPGADGFRLTAANIQANRSLKQYVEDIEVRSWLAEAEGISKPFAGPMQILNQDHSGGDLIAWDALGKLWDRNIGKASLELNVWQAWMLGHGYDPKLVMTDLQDDLGDFSTLTNFLRIVSNTLDAVPAKFDVVLVIGDILPVDVLNMTISGFAPEYESAAITKVDGALVVNVLTLDGAGLMTIEMTGGPIVVGTHTLCTISLDDAPDNATLLNKRLIPVITKIEGTSTSHLSQFSVIPFRYRIAVEDAQLGRELPVYRDDGTRRSN